MGGQILAGEGQILSLVGQILAPIQRQNHYRKAIRPKTAVDSPAASKRSAECGSCSMRRTLRIVALGTAALLISVCPAVAAGQYVHVTVDQAYLDDDGTVLTDPYGVGEGAQSSSRSVLYWGPLANGDTHHTLEAAGWPYTRTRAVLAVAFPCIPNRYCFDHDAAAQLLANGLTWAALDRLYEKR